MSTPHEGHGNWPDANELIRLVNCIQQVQHESYGWSSVDCAMIGTCFLLSIVCLVLTFLMICFEISYRGSFKEAFKHSKMWIYSLCIPLYCLTFTRYFLVPARFSRGFF